MTFTAQLRQESDELFQKIYDHPFVQGISKGKLKPEQLIHYVEQDFQYLSVFVQMYALGIMKTKNREDMEFFHQQIGVTLHSEAHPHQNFCREAGVDFTSLQQVKSLAPSARNYMNHMLCTAQTGTLADLYAVILPCPWTYIYIAERIMEENSPTEDHPFYDWIQFYAGDDFKTLNQELRSRLDHLAKSMTSSEHEKLKEAFQLSCIHEFNFWNMAYTLESYSFGK
ncbi:thiaminase II [Hazenella coriacea]|uniref:Aminopyrimidine aminohydrolase n=1 Tax=Hazenella coriacea TaxID=1179467 RepID=A0A4R3L5C7_9BACL|nr:thiaminase II [Hazenella coriacea]TCS94839.1 thiaminase/transcriptional activator TenA [Hazenella coriacea]